MCLCSAVFVISFRELCKRDASVCRSAPPVLIENLCTLFSNLLLVRVSCRCIEERQEEDGRESETLFDIIY